jgi:hypothetical protein
MYAHNPTPCPPASLARGVDRPRLLHPLTRSRSPALAHESWPPIARPDHIPGRHQTIAIAPPPSLASAETSAPAGTPAPGSRPKFAIARTPATVPEPSISEPPVSSAPPDVPHSELSKLQATASGTPGRVSACARSLTHARCGTQPECHTRPGRALIIVASRISARATPMAYVCI